MKNVSSEVFSEEDNILESKPLLGDKQNSSDYQSSSVSEDTFVVEASIQADGFVDDEGIQEDDSVVEASNHWKEDKEGCFVSVYRNIVYALMNIDDVPENLLKKLVIWENCKPHPPIYLRGDARIKIVQYLNNMLRGPKILTNIMFPAVFFVLLMRDFVKYHRYIPARVDNNIAKLLFWFTENQYAVTSQMARSWVWPVSMMATVITATGIDLFLKICLSNGRGELFETDTDNVPRDKGWWLWNLLDCLPFSSFRRKMARYRRRITLYNEDQFNQDSVFQIGDGDDEEGTLYGKRYKRVSDSKNLTQSNIKALANRNNITSLIAISTLAKIVSEFSDRRLAKLPTGIAEGCKEIRDQALTHLKKIIEEDPSFVKRAYANYLLWKNGFSHQYRYDIFFISAALLWTSYVLYSNYRFFVSFFQSSVEAGNFNRAMRRCLELSRVFVYMPLTGRFECSICGDWQDVFYQNIYESQSCIDDLLSMPQEAETVIEALKRTRHFGLSHLDLSQQNWWQWSVEQLRTVFTLAHENIEGVLDYFILGPETQIPTQLSQEQTDIIYDFLILKDIKYLDLANVVFADNSIIRAISTMGGVLTGLDLSDMNLSYEDAKLLAKYLPNLPNLSVFRANNNLFDNESIVVLSEGLVSANITHLSLAGNPFDETGLVALASRNFTSLQTLDISNLPLETNDLSALVPLLEHSNLEELAMNNSGVTDQNLPTFVNSLRDSNLQSLSLSQNELTEISGFSLGRAMQNSTLSELILTDTFLSDDGVAYLSEFLPNTNLERLNLENTGLGDIGAQYLGKALLKKKLQLLNIARNHLTAIGVSDIDQAICVGNLVEVVFDGNILGNLGLDSLSESLRCSNATVESLGLVNTGIADIGEFFHSISNDTSLKSLALQNNNLLEPGYVLAMERLGGTSLEHLNLANTAATPAVIDAISGQLALSKLRSLDISHNKLNDISLISFLKKLLNFPLDIKLLLTKTISWEVKQLIQSAKAMTNLQDLRLENTAISTDVGRATCRIAASHLSLVPALGENHIDPELVNINSCYTSAASRPELPAIFQWVKWLFVTTSQILKRLFSLVVQIPKAFIGTGSAEMIPIMESPKVSDIVGECFVNGNTLECEGFSVDSKGEVSAFYLLAEIAKWQIMALSIAKFALQFLIGSVFAFRTVIAEKVKPFLPKKVVTACKNYSKTKESVLVNEVGTFAVRANYSAASLGHDVASFAKDLLVPREKGTGGNEYMLVKTVVGLLCSAVFYGAAFGIGYLLGNMFIAMALSHLFTKIPKICGRTVGCYKNFGLFAACETAADELVLAAPGGEYLRRVLAE